MPEDTTIWTEFQDRDVVDWKRVRAAIEHENSLTNHRFTWLLTSQGFLSSGYFITWQTWTKVDPASDQYWQLRWILGVIIVIGFLISLQLAFALCAAHNQHRALELWWGAIRKTTTRHPPISGFKQRFPLSIPYYYIAVSFTLAWTVFGVIAYSKLFASYTDALIHALPYIGVLVVGTGFGLLVRRKPEKPPKDTE